MSGDPILVVDDDDALRASLVAALESLPVEITAAAGGAEAVAILKERRFAAVVTDLVMRDVDGFAVLAAAKESYSNCRVVMLTGHGSRDVAVQAMERGATYYVEKPVDLGDLRTKVRKCLEDHRKDLAYDDLRGQMERAYGIEGIVGQDPKILRVLEVVRQIAGTAASVLILGPSGTGKELVARAIHGLSPRARKPFVPINCGGMSEGTIESELFGHVKGAYTGAVADREGKFEYANGGTLLLDEVGDMPMATQIKLLRVLEEGEIVRVGSNETIKVNVRLLSATNQDLEEAIARGTFRKDLYYRLKVATVRLAPLRQRRADIPLLIDHFIKEMTKTHGKPMRGMSPAARRALMAFNWPGNVRQLRNAIESMIVVDSDGLLDIDDLQQTDVVPTEDAVGLAMSDGAASLIGRPLDEVEKYCIEQALRLTQGNREEAARMLGIGERSIYRKIKEYKLDV
jgi:two-component system response regulator HydG